MEKVLSFPIRHEKRKVLPDGTLIAIEILHPIGFHEVNGIEEGNTREEETAMHEIAHAFVAIVKGVPVIAATIIPESLNGLPTLGHVDLGTHPADGLGFDANDDENVYAPIYAASHSRSGNSTDRRIVEGRYGKGSFERAAKIAQEILSQNKKKVRAVAAVLLKEKKLTGERIQKIIDSVDEEDSENVRIRLIRPGGKEEIIMRKAKKGDAIDIPLLAPADLPREHKDSVIDRLEDEGERLAA